MLYIKTKFHKVNENLTEAIPMPFELPKEIHCPEDGEIMKYSKTKDGYYCKECKLVITCDDYIDLAKKAKRVKKGQKSRLRKDQSIDL